MKQMRVRAALPAIVLVTLAVLPAPAQAPLEFEVAAIGPHTGADTDPSVTPSLTFSPGGRFTAVNVTVRKLIRNAFEVADFQISGAPGWVDSTGYDIEAKTAAGIEVTDKNISPLLLSLLQKRFQLRYHRVTKEMTEYALEVAKGGPKLKLHVDNGKSFLNTTTLRAGIVTLAAHKISIDDLAYHLRQQLGRPVIDKTGLTGEFDINLIWSSEQATDTTEPSVFAALQKLGLRLVSMKGPVDMLVIDGVEKASEN